MGLDDTALLHIFDKGPHMMRPQLVVLFSPLDPASSIVLRDGKVVQDNALSCTHLAR